MSVLGSGTVSPEQTLTRLLQNAATTSLGNLRLAGEIHEGNGVARTPPLRVYGRYAVVCITRGAGDYRDFSGLHREVQTGDVIFVFPERPHWYGPRRRQRWDELHVTFDGPLFDLYRRARLLDDTQPVRRAPGGWIEALRRTIKKDAVNDLIRLVDFIELLHVLFRDAPQARADGMGKEGVLVPAPTSEVERARAALAIDLGKPCDLARVARDVGLSYENFRKRFQRETGVSPAHYRLTRRIEAACELLRYAPQMTNRQVAQTLGFADEYHFSRRFTQIAGTTPRAFRREAAGETAPIAEANRDEGA